MKLTDTKIIVSGSTIEVYRYLDRKLSYNFVVVQSVNKHEHDFPEWLIEERKLKSREDSMRRARSYLRRLINTNAYKWSVSNGTYCTPKFVTLTFKKNIKDVKIANGIFSKFIKRLNYYESNGNKESFLKYVVVTEFQKRGAIHYHTIFFNLEYIWGDTLESIWGNGMVDIKKIDSIDNTGAYVCKYMSKEFGDDRLNGKKRYFSSRELIKPVVIKQELMANKILYKIPKEYLKKNKTYKDASDNRIQYLCFQIDRRDSFVDIVPELREFL